MRRFIISTHGNFGKSLIRSAKLITGSDVPFQSIEMEEANTTDDVRHALRAALSGMGPTDELVILTDILGGSVCNTCTEFMLADSRTHLLAGVNLSMILTMFFWDEETPVEDLIRECVQTARDSILYVNDQAKSAVSSAQDNNPLL